MFRFHVTQKTNHFKLEIRYVECGICTIAKSTMNKLFL